MRIFANPDTRREGLLIIYNDKTVPPRRGTSPEGAEGVSRPRAAIMAVLCAMRDGSGGGKSLRPCGPPPLQGGGVPTMQQKFQSPEHRVSEPEPGTPSFRAWNTQFQGLEHTVSKPGTHSFKRLEHPVSRPETLRALGAPIFSSKKGFPVAKEALITTIPKGLFHHLHHLVALLHDINAFLQAFKTIANLHSA